VLGCGNERRDAVLALAPLMFSRELARDGFRTNRDQARGETGFIRPVTL